MNVFNDFYTMFVNSKFNFNFGAVYDVTGEGFYVDPEDWVNGRSGNQGMFKINLNLQKGPKS